MALPPEELFRRVKRRRLVERSLGALLTTWRAFRTGLRRERAPAMPTAEALAALERAPPFRFPSETAPTVSVIVPVYGQKAATLHCLASLAREPCRCRFEVVVVDDRSPDDTLTALRRIEGLVLVENEVNLGFIGASNAGARAARGRYLCFLNNDTSVTPGWLDHLLSTFERHPSAGLVGARLLFPDGRIQEAGGTVFRDASGSHFGRNRWPGRSAFEFVRPVDYVSGACAMVARELFQELGGFDPYYTPAYYEDTDLAFRIRRRGYEVLHQPAARVFHYEGVTHGKDVTKGLKRHQIINRDRFERRWRETLTASHPSPGRRSQRAADRRMGPRLLFVAHGLRSPLFALAQAAAHRARPCWWSPKSSSADRAALGQDSIEALGPSDATSLTQVLAQAPGNYEAVFLDPPPTQVEAWVDRARGLGPDLRLLLHLPSRTPAAPRAADAVLTFEASRPSSVGSPPAIQLSGDEAGLRRWCERDLPDFLRRR